MSSDQAKISYDKKQQYRAVVMQQGRVTVEADWNEAQQINNEEIRQEACDFVGPCGTPNNGYEITQTSINSTSLPPFDFTVGAGTMYVDGLRVHLDKPVQYGTQQEWLDHKTDPDWVNPSSLTNSDTQQEFVYLYLREQEVSAVEDSSLREVALGGPDTAQRLRLIQHIVRLNTPQATDCCSAIKVAADNWEHKGLNFHKSTLRLKSWGTLKVAFQNLNSSSDPCNPEAHGGYLEADNQLIRIQISPNSNLANTWKLVWGFDNASFLYRVDPVDKDNQTLRLQSRPIDAFHELRANQAVEVLQAAVLLSNGEYIAAATGFVTTLTTPYNHETQTVSLANPFPSDYLETDQIPRPPLFLRVWEEELPFTPETPVVLGKTGLQVILRSSSAGKLFHVGDYWSIAVRPNTPTEVYPHRYLENYQPPDGPRLWVCPLAVINWEQQMDNCNGDLVKLQILDDCRKLFDNLVDLTKRKLSGCCTVNIRPEDVTGNNTLQSILDQYYGSNTLPQQITICLMPGTYSLATPLRINPEHSNLTLEGCNNGVIIQADTTTDHSLFLDGLIVLTQANHVTLRNLQLELPLVPFTKAASNFENMNLELLSTLQQLRLPNLRTAIGIRPISCANLTIENCVFHFPLRANFDVFEAGIFAGGKCDGLKVQGNRFLCEETRTPDSGSLIPVSPVVRVETPAAKTAIPESTKANSTSIRASASDSVTSSSSEFTMPTSPSSSPDINSLSTLRWPSRLIFGYLMLPSGILASTSSEPTSTQSSSRERGQVMGALLQDAIFRDNLFEGLTFATFVISDGTVKFESNTVRKCVAGIWLESLSFWSAVSPELVINQRYPMTALEEKELGVFNEDLSLIFTTPAIVFAIALALFYPLPQSTLSQQSLDICQVGRDTTEISAAVIQHYLSAAHKAGLSLSAHLYNNTVDTLKIDREIISIGLLILGEFPQESRENITNTDTNSDTIVSANKILNKATKAPTVFIISTQYSVITGNLFLNEAHKIVQRCNYESQLNTVPTAFSLIFIPGLSNSHSRFAITGNVLRGESNLRSLRRPMDTFPHSFDTWSFTNSQI